MLQTMIFNSNSVTFEIRVYLGRGRWYVWHGFITLQVSNFSFISNKLLYNNILKLGVSICLMIYKYLEVRKCLWRYLVKQYPHLWDFKFVEFLAVSFCLWLASLLKWSEHLKWTEYREHLIRKVSSGAASGMYDNICNNKGVYIPDVYKLL